MCTRLLSPRPHMSLGMRLWWPLLNLIMKVIYWPSFSKQRDEITYEGIQCSSPQDNTGQDETDNKYQVSINRCFNLWVQIITSLVPRPPPFYWHFCTLFWMQGKMKTEDLKTRLQSNHTESCFHFTSPCVYLKLIGTSLSKPHTMHCKTRAYACGHIL